MRRFLNNLQQYGFDPKVVVTDGSNLYPTVLAEIWPRARHQLCVFHVIKVCPQTVAFPLSQDGGWRVFASNHKNVQFVEHVNP
jgi:hypothetical protein